MKAKMIIFAVNDNEAPDGFKFELIPQRFKYYMQDEDINLGEVELLYRPPENVTPDALLLAAIQTMKDKQERVIAEAVVEKERLQEKINHLLMLTHATGADVIASEVILNSETKTINDDEIPF